jgi:CDP-glucose 4,6-dehydratase
LDGGMVMDTCFGGVYKGTKVFITGHTGFKGSWLALWLKRLGAEVCGYALAPPSNPSHFDLLSLEMTSIISDVRDAEALARAMADFQPDIVFHMAAQPLVRLGYREPAETFETNIMGTVNLFEACRKTTSVKAIVNITSDKCYENKEWIWGYRENDPMGGYDPYSASKGCAELVANCYRRSYFNNASFGKEHNTLLASCRAGNVIGGGDWADDRLVPDIMKAADKNETVTIRNPVATRPWQHVLEPLSGYLCVGAKLLKAEAACADGWNFGPAEEGNVSVGEVAEACQEYWSDINLNINTNPADLHEAHLLHLDCSKAAYELKWRAVWNITTTLEKTVNWYKAYYQNESLQSQDDLDAYISDAAAKGLPWATSEE